MRQEDGGIKISIAATSRSTLGARQGEGAGPPPPRVAGQSSDWRGGWGRGG